MYIIYTRMRNIYMNTFVPYILYISTKCIYTYVSYIYKMNLLTPTSRNHLFDRLRMLRWEGVSAPFTTLRCSFIFAQSSPSRSATGRVIST